MASSNRLPGELAARLTASARRLLFVCASALIVLAMGSGPDRAAFTTAASAAVVKQAAPANPSAVLRRKLPSALSGNRDALRLVAKAIVALGPRPVPSAAALRPLLRNEAQRGSSAAAVAYGMLLQWGIGGPANTREAPTWYAKASSIGNRSATQHAALAYAVGWGVSRNTTRALQLLSKLDAERRAKLMISISDALMQPGREEPDVAAAWLRRAADLKTPASIKAIARYEAMGGQDPQAANATQTWLRGLAEKGDVNASLELAERLTAMGGADEQSEAARWLLAAAEKGDPRAVERLTALLAISGSGGPRGNPVQSFLEEKASAGSNAARFSLAEAYAYRSGPGADEQSRSRAYLEQAAKSGNRDAQYKLGMLLLAGADDDENRTLARAYLSLAAAEGDPIAKQAAAGMGLMTTPQARALIERGTPAGNP